MIYFKIYIRVAVLDAIYVTLHVAFAVWQETSKHHATLQTRAYQ